MDNVKTGLGGNPALFPSLREFAEINTPPAGVAVIRANGEYYGLTNPYWRGEVDRMFCASIDEAFVFADADAAVKASFVVEQIIPGFANIRGAYLEVCSATGNVIRRVNFARKLRSPNREHRANRATQA